MTVPLFTGKNDARLPQVMLPEEMLELIRQRAERMNRPMGAEIRHLLMEGLYRDREINVYECLILDSLRFAQPRKAPHDNMRNREKGVA